MKNQNEISILSELRSGYSSFDDKEEPFYHALSEGIKALRLIGYLNDRPCTVCKFHGENGCCKWNCVFEDQKESDNV